MRDDNNVVLQIAKLLKEYFPNTEFTIEIENTEIRIYGGDHYMFKMMLHRNGAISFRIEFFTYMEDAKSVLRSAKEASDVLHYLERNAEHWFLLINAPTIVK